MHCVRAVGQVGTWCAISYFALPLRVLPGLCPCGSACYELILLQTDPVHLILSKKVLTVRSITLILYLQQYGTLQHLLRQLNNNELLYSLTYQNNLIKLLQHKRQRSNPDLKHHYSSKFILNVNTNTNLHYQSLAYTHNHVPPQFGSTIRDCCAGHNAGICSRLDTINGHRAGDAGVQERMVLFQYCGPPCSDNEAADAAAER